MSKAPLARRSPAPLLIACALLGPTIAACAPDAGPADEVGAAASGLVAGPAPEVPALLPPIHLMEADAFVRPSIPPYRTSADGRLALALTKSGSNIVFRMYAPETLATPWVEAPAGVIGLAAGKKTSPNADYYAYPYVHPIPFNLATTDHRTICDAWPVANPVTNPYPCATNNAHDCYDVTVVSTFRLDGSHVQLHGKPVRVEVADPKTDHPTIVSVDTNTVPLGAPPVAVGPVLRADFGLEPMITSDGHLLVMRLGDTITTNPITGAASDRLDIVYLASDATELPCDVGAWTEWQPITHAPFDTANDLPGRYGFAQYPLRDGKGVPFVDGEDLGGSYPWIDRAGNNLFFTVLSSTLWYRDTATGLLGQRYADTCVAPAACVDPVTVADLTNDLENDEQFRGFAFAGLWSRGKTVLLDNLANNTDYGLGRSDGEQRMLALYTDGVNPVSVRVGTGRDNGGPVPANAVDNTTFLDSWENLFAHDHDARPTTVRDVVWLINTGKATVELAFDDYLDADALIVSDGSAATTKAHPFAATNQPTYLDGFVQAGGRGAAFVGGGELANAATPLATRWGVPASGVLAANLRVEPVALGGVVGKGLWLPGADDNVTYTMPVQQAGVVAPTTRTISLFLDPRFGDDGVIRSLLTFPDGTQVDLIGLSYLRYKRNGYTAPLVDLTGYPLTQGAWNHLAWIVTGDGGTLHFVRDGYRYRTTVLPGARKMMGVLPLAGGTFIVGSRPGFTGVRGWIDEIKVFARDLDLEHVCNLGRGTLVQLTAGSSTDWDTLAGEYTTHGALRVLLGAAPGTQFACFHDYTAPDLALRDHLPTDAVSVRDALLFPEGPLHAASPRPDSTANRFCQGCHVDDGVAPASLLPDALAADASTLDADPTNDLAAQDDPRRQPMQPPARIFGNVPLDHFVTADPESLPNAAFIAPPEGTPVDPYVIP